MAPMTDRRSRAHWRAVCSENCTHGSVGGAWKSAAQELRQLAGRLPYLVDGNRDLDDPTDRTHAGLFRGFILRNSDVGAAALTLDVFLYRHVCGNHVIWGFQHVAGFRRRHVGASIQTAWTTSLDSVRAALDADTAND